MQAFHGDPSIKAKYLDRVRMHAKADEIIHGKYWENGKGCAVGCTIHGRNHLDYESEMGIPSILAHLEDRLFEGQGNGRAKEFPERFLLAAKVGADLSRVGWKFLHWLLTEELASRDDPSVANQIKRCADVLVPLTKGEPCDKQAARADAAYAAAAAAAAAYAAAYAADAAARSKCYERMAEKLLELMAECEGEPIRVAI